MKQKVLMVHNFYKIGGGEHTVFENEVEMLRKNGHEVYTYTRSNAELDTSKIKLLLLPFTTIWSVKTFREVKNIIRKENIDVVHCHNTFPLISPSVYYAARSRKVPVVQTIHNFRFLCPNGVLYRDNRVCEECINKKSFVNAVHNKCYRNSKIQTIVVVAMLKIHRWLRTYKKIAYIFLTDFNKKKFDNLIGNNNEKVFIKPNFVKSRPIIEKREQQNKRNIFVYAGRLEENKGIRFLLEEWKNLPSDFELHIYGDGTLREYVEQKACELNNVIYFGFKAQKDIFEDLVDSQALLFPSTWYEGFPMILVESFSIGIPVVATDIGNQKNIIEISMGGVCFEDGNKNAFRMALQEIITNNNYYAQNAFKYYEHDLSEEYNYRLLFNIYNQL